MATDDLATPERLVQLVVFRLGEEEYAVNVFQVQEIVRFVPPTAVPRAPHFIEGVINLRGRVVPVLDLARRFALPPAPRNKATRIIIAAIQGKTVGLLVDGVSEVLNLAGTAIDPAPEMLRSTHASEFLTGIGKHDGRLLLLLDLHKVLEGNENEQLAAFDANTDLARPHT